MGPRSLMGPMIASYGSESPKDWAWAMAWSRGARFSFAWAYSTAALSAAGLRPACSGVRRCQSPRGGK